MKTTLAAALIAITTAATGAVLAPQMAAAGSLTLFNRLVSGPAASLGPMTLAYAPESQANQAPFDQLEAEEEMHELNDAWLGMPAFDADGKLIGVIEDAYLNEDGTVSELLVSLTNSDYAVYIDGQDAALTETEVAIALTESVIAGLERAQEFSLVQR
ncbi:MAG: PRC-barrel domain-containing protein [Nitratireductor sp.]|nr:PRC-barrel domain-containing protein [Nitratireductor sp.]